jgi:uncharacterized protein
LERHGFEIIGKKLLDTPPVSIGQKEAMTEGIELFNMERFWESHEVLEQIWRGSRGSERDTIQGLILTAAAFVHYQKNEPDICLSVLKRARIKIADRQANEIMELDALRENIDLILDSGHIRTFKIGIMDH